MKKKYLVYICIILFTLLIVLFICLRKDDKEDLSLDNNIEEDVLSLYEEGTLIYKMLEDNPIIKERTDFNGLNNYDTTGIIYKTNLSEDKSTIYYYSGNTTNNWVKFGKYNTSKVIGYYYDKNNLEEYNTLEECNQDTYSFNCHYLYEKGEDIYWRIIRTNIDDSVRLLYAGNNIDGTEGYIGMSPYNKKDNEAGYIGYMYGGSNSLNENRMNTTDSLVKTYIDKWYKDNLLDSYDKYISKSAVYCNDRSISEGTWVNTGSTFYFGGYSRLSINSSPTYKCSNNKKDKFSVSDISGNGKLVYPIALMTADEIVFAGGKYLTNLESPYAYYYTNSLGNNIVNGYYWWTMTPSLYSATSANIFSVGGGGSLKYYYLYSSDATRPVISISSCTKVNGNGTPDNPYIIDEINSTC